MGRTTKLHSTTTVETGPGGTARVVGYADTQLHAVGEEHRAEREAARGRLVAIIEYLDRHVRMGANGGDEERWNLRVYETPSC